MRGPALVIALSVACHPGGRASGAADTSAADARPQPVATTQQSQRPRGPLVGDTLDLYSVGGLALPWQDARSRPCAPAEPPAFERLRFLDDSTYAGARARRPGCQPQGNRPTDTTKWTGPYRLHGDTLTLYVGGGDEVEETFNGRVFPETVVQFDIERSRLARYLRRHPPAPAASEAARTGTPQKPGDQWDRANAATVRLLPAAFPLLPPAVRADLERRQCRIPQTFLDTVPANVVKGSFRTPGQTDWAVLCSRGDTSRILVYWAGSPEAPDSLAPRPDRGELQGGVGTGIGYSRALGVASPDYIRRHFEAYGGPTPPPLDHDGINDIFVEKASVVLYWFQGRWLELTGAD